MKIKKVIVFTLVLSLLISATLVMTSAATTEGSIDFKATDVTVVTPEGPCCPCFEDDPCDGEPGCKHDPECEDPCDCLCHDDDEDDYNNFFKDKDVVDNLYFGNHSIREFGRFDSANTKLHNDNGLDTTDVGQFTGVEVRNFSGVTFKLGVEVGPFINSVSSQPTLNGAELRLIPAAHEAPNAYPLLPGFEFTALAGAGATQVVPNDGGMLHVLTLPSANMVKASWSGLLDTAQGTAEVGKAQAELTWTDLSNTP